MKKGNFVWEEFLLFPPFFNIENLGGEKKKMKNKTLALMEIAIVLCSVFLVALPAIATDQNQTTQKVIASEVTTASEDDYVLGIYGNANEDGTIDMRDYTHTARIICWLEDETDLGDANYDGRISVADMTQIGLIILGRESELTFETAPMPMYGIPPEVVTVHKPVERIVVMWYYSADVLRALDAKDKIVGVTTYIQDEKIYYPELSKLPSVGAWELDYEAILSLNPDILIQWGMPGDYKEKLPGVTVIFLGLSYPELFTDGVRKLGYILDKRNEADEYIRWHEGHINKIKSRTEGLSEDKKPRVFNWAFFKPGVEYITCKDDNIHQMCIMAGGKDIADELEGSGCPEVDPEWIVEQNPDVITALALTAYISDGYGTDDPSEMSAAREDILSRPELANVTAVETGSVYMMNFLALAGSGCLIGTAYMAKWFHPDLFEDLDPEAIHQEYLDRFQRIDYDLDEHGVFVYPELS